MTPVLVVTPVLVMTPAVVVTPIVVVPGDQAGRLPRRRRDCQDTSHGPGMRGAPRYTRDILEIYPIYQPEIYPRYQSGACQVPPFVATADTRDIPEIPARDIPEISARGMSGAAVCGDGRHID